MWDCLTSVFYILEEINMEIIRIVLMVGLVIPPVLYGGWLRGHYKGISAKQKMGQAIQLVATLALICIMGGDYISETYGDLYSDYAFYIGVGAAILTYIVAAIVIYFKFYRNKGDKTEINHDDKEDKNV